MRLDCSAIARSLFGIYVKSSEKYELCVSLPDVSLCEPYLSKHKADMLIIEIMTKDGKSGFDTVRRIKEKHPALKIVAVSSVPESGWPGRAKRLGVESFWYKEYGDRTLPEVMDLTAAGISVYPDRPPVVTLGLAKSSELTDRELEVLRVITAGATNGAAAKELGISENTVKAHVRNLLVKTGFQSSAELAIKARVTGIAVK